jgi:hypothetical protein
MAQEKLLSLGSFPASAKRSEQRIRPETAMPKGAKIGFKSIVSQLKKRREK